MAGSSSSASVWCCDCGASGSRAQHRSSIAPNISRDTPSAHSSHAERSPLLPSTEQSYIIFIKTSSTRLLLFKLFSLCETRSYREHFTSQTGELWPSRMLPKGIALPNVIIKGLERRNFSIIIQNIITSNGVKEWSSPCRRRVSLLNLSPSNVCICAVRGRRRRGGDGVQCINLQ
ncbi:hypothetical protein HW555_004742 [Spodoptera exigua]|uniref:Uncharacterized protein n=1 Tax=Spodoptera exigua TaxID=7107 RepID=A0A835LBW9_SPOEX|nr:hypothetical protein HW555_004742 [Spodoptera exigua]